MTETKYPAEILPWKVLFDGLEGQGIGTQEARKAAFEAFAAKGIPSTKHEEWKYTSVLDIAGKPRHIAKTASALPNPDAWSSLLPAGVEMNIVVLIDGQFSDVHSKWLDQSGIEFVSLAASQVSIGITDAPESPFVALNAALANHGYQLHVRKRLQYPIGIIHVTTQQGDTSLHQRLVTTLADGCSAHLYEAFLHLGGDVLLNNVHEITVGNDAVMHHDILQNAVGINQIGFTQVYQGKGSQYHSFVLSTEGALVRNNLHVRHDGQHCETHLLGIYLLDGASHVDNHTLVDHAQPNCYSNELYKGVLAGKSTAVFNGKVMVRLDAQKTNAFQSNRTVLLSPAARINTKPQLEIFADDVKCSHGATTGRLDEQALFYLRSRGLSLKAAMSLLTFAFAAEVLEKMSHEGMRNHFKAIVEAKLNALATQE